MRPWLIAPLALLGTACTSWYRAGPQVRTVDGHLAVEGKATLEGGLEQMAFPLALSGGATTDDGEGIFALETGAEWVGEIDNSSWAYVAGPRFVGELSGPTGTCLGLNAGPFVNLDSEETVLSLELFGGVGTSGEISNGAVGGVTLSVGALHRGVFTIPHGRVLRDGARAITARARAQLGWSKPIRVPALPFEARLRVGREWLHAALDEHASIAAFLELERTLAEHGAPPMLRARALRAACDEARHARICFSLASSYLGVPLGPGPLPPRNRARVSLADVARESLVDGCFGEGLAAELARRRARDARDPVTRAAQRIIAVDEARHARLGWDTLSWCAEQSEGVTRLAVEEGLDEIRRNSTS